jgi:peptidoglycan/xylan/chitin deacetylase (PgdA/CDA1 family)
MTALGLAARAAKAAQVRLARNIKLNGLNTRLDEAVVSFSFDDFPRSALTEGGRMLKARGWAGTYFAAGGFCGRRVDGIDYFDRDDLVQADADGHEIGCHTFGHLRLPQEKPRAILADLQRNRDFIADVLPGHALSSFAYPYGDLDLGRKALIAGRFPVCRGIWPGLNTGRMDFAQLKAAPLERRSLDALDVDELLDRAVAAKAWLIFFTHDLDPDPSPYGCRPDQFEAVLDKVAARGVRVLPIKNAAGAARFNG